MLAGASALAVRTTHRPSELGGSLAVLPDLSVIQFVPGGVTWPS
jgi:hypothetical protein